MYLQKLQLTNFRNYEDLQIEFSKNVNVFVGNNAHGKTNILESIYLSSITKSYRTSKDVECIKFEKELGLQVFPFGKSVNFYNKEIDNMPHKKVVALGENDNVTYLKNSIFSYVLDIDEEDMSNKVLSTLVDKKEDVKIRNYITDLLVISLDKNKVVTKTYDIKE